MNTYNINKQAQGFLIGSVKAHGRGLVLRSTGITPQVEVRVSPEFTTRVKPKTGDYYIKYSNGYETTVSEETYQRDFVDNEDAIKFEVEDYGDDKVEEVAVLAYRVHYLEQHGNFDNGKPMPTAEELFNDEQHEERATGWLVAAATELDISIPEEDEEPTESSEGSDSSESSEGSDSSE